MTPTPRNGKATRTATADSPSAAASRYQQLRSHLAELRPAEAVPAVHDHATAQGLSLRVELERLLAVKSTPQRPGGSGRLRLGCLPHQRPWPTSTSTPLPASTER
jgi:hypothetical protein